MKVTELARSGVEKGGVKVLRSILVCILENVKEFQTWGPLLKNGLLERDNYQCQECGDTESPLEIDHINEIRTWEISLPGHLKRQASTINFICEADEPLI